MRLGLGAFYRPAREAYSARVSVIIPLAAEDEVTFRAVLASIVKQEPFEIIVVINGAKDPQLERVCGAN